MTVVNSEFENEIILLESARIHLGFAKDGLVEVNDALKHVDSMRLVVAASDLIDALKALEKELKE